MNKIEIKSLNDPDYTKNMIKETVQIVSLEGSTISRATFQPGWRWSKHTGTAKCHDPHVLLSLSGTMRFKMDDGTEQECKAGDVCYISPGHDSWVVGDEPAVIVNLPDLADRTPQTGPQDQLDLLSSVVV